jgi:hypothetical protein
MKQRNSSGAKKRSYAINPNRVQEQANASTSDWDVMFKESVPRFKPRSGENRIRILPPTFDGAEYWGREVWVHYGIGAEGKSSYLCLNKNHGEPCPFCEESNEAQREGESEYAKTLAPKKRMAIWLIDRKEASKGPQLWLAPAGFDKDVAKRSIDKRTKALLSPCDVDEGYDVYFDCNGTGARTKYESVELDREPSPLAKDPARGKKWLRFVTDNPLGDDQLVYYDYDHLANVFSGKAAKEEDDEDEAPRGRTRSERSSSKSKSKRGRDEEDEESEDEEEEDEDEAPRRKSKASKRSRDEDDEDSDDEEEFEDAMDEAFGDDEDEAPRRKPSKSKRAPVDDDEDDSDDDDSEDEDEDEAPRRKSSKAAPKRNAKKAAKYEEDDDSEEEDDEDSDDDEEDADDDEDEAPRRKPGKSVRDRISKARSKGR